MKRCSFMTHLIYMSSSRTSIVNLFSLVNKKIVNDIAHTFEMIPHHRNIIVSFKYQLLPPYRFFPPKKFDFARLLKFNRCGLVLNVDLNGHPLLVIHWLYYSVWLFNYYYIMPEWIYMKCVAIALRMSCYWIPSRCSSLSNCCFRSTIQCLFLLNTGN